MLQRNIQLLLEGGACRLVLQDGSLYRGFSLLYNCVTPSVHCLYLLHQISLEKPNHAEAGLINPCIYGTLQSALIM